ncbi:MAG TPA: hypothetical protein VF457_17035, partial [Burkholderiaceae bacterium]
MPPPRPPFTDEELAARRPVWDALSDLFLDTDIEEPSMRASRARRLAASPYPIEALEDILAFEVHPHLWPNLFSVAGVWSAFDMDWLEARIVASAARPAPPLRAWSPVRWWVARWSD